MSDIWWSLPLTIAIFFASRKLAKKLKLSVINPLLITIMVIIPLLLLLKLPYTRYFQGSRLLNDLLQPAIIALALPLYEQLHQIRAHWKSIISLCFIGSLTAMISGTVISLWLGATPQIAATLLPKSVTTSIAMVISGTLGGIPAISAICVLLAGVLGAVFGHMILNVLRIRSTKARGLAIGNASHALGTARAAEIDYQEGAFSTLALVLCGIITSFLAPFVFSLLLALWS